MTTKREQCEEIEQTFKEKFKVFPVVFFRKDARGEFYFTLELEPTFSKPSNFYKMGETIEGAKRYIDMLFRIPNNTITFESHDDVETYKNNKKEEIKKKKKEKLAGEAR